jgi:hypothetical protein
MVLPYLKGSLYILVFIIVWMHFGYSEVKGFYLLSTILEEILMVLELKNT